MHVKASVAWVMASIAVAAVMCGGSVSVILGSITAALGSRNDEVNGSFTDLVVSVMTATDVTSEPVPAVVGTTRNGFSGCLITPAPL